MHFEDVSAGRLDFVSIVCLEPASIIVLLIFGDQLKAINKLMQSQHVPHVFPAICSFESTSDAANKPVFCVVYEHDDKTTTLADYVG